MTPHNKSGSELIDGDKRAAGAAAAGGLCPPKSTHMWGASVEWCLISARCPDTVSHTDTS